MARYGLFVLKVLLNPFQPTSDESFKMMNWSHFISTTV